MTPVADLYHTDFSKQLQLLTYFEQKIEMWWTYLKRLEELKWILIVD